MRSGVVARDAELPGSKIILKHGLLDDPLLRDSLIARFLAQGVVEESITCLGTTSRDDHLAAFAQVDISLDTFPQNGGISTWESLYKGVPVVAKLGIGASSRAGASIVAAVGLSDWVAEDDDGYVEIARKFASQPNIWRNCAWNCRPGSRLRPPAMSRPTRVSSRRVTESSGATIVPPPRMTSTLRRRGLRWAPASSGDRRAA